MMGELSPPSSVTAAGPGSALKYAPGSIEPFTRTYLPAPSFHCQTQPQRFGASPSAWSFGKFYVGRWAQPWCYCSAYVSCTLEWEHTPFFLFFIHLLPVFVFPMLSLASRCWKILIHFSGMFYSTSPPPPTPVVDLVVDFPILILFVLHWGAAMWWGDWPKSNPIYAACGGFIWPCSGQCDRGEFC